MAERTVACPDCGSSFNVPAHLATDAGQETVLVRLTGKVNWALFDIIKVPIFVDGQRVGEGSVKRGFDVVVEMAVGRHKVEIGTAPHMLDFAQKGRFDVEFEYSKMWGKYSLPPKVRRVAAGHLDDWPTPPIKVETIKAGISANDEGVPAEQAESVRRRLAEAEISSEDEEVLAGVEQLQNRKSGWGAAIGLLAVSLLLFTAAAGVQDIWASLFILIPVLAFHELGHYVAMLAFGYRNVRMFFIPFFGAAVSGRHYNIAGWKKAVVALAGPLPGIFVGSLIGVIGLVVQAPRVVEAGLYTLILNGFNLLPFLPLDGGWVVHAVLFVRNAVLDVVFRVGAALCMLLIAVLAQAWCLAAVAAFMLLIAPRAYRLARIAYRLGQEGLVTRSPDGNSIPPQAALQILAELRRSLPKQTPPSVLAQNVADVFEIFNAAPPGILVSIALLMLQALAFVTALAMGVVLAVFQHRPG
jgi:Zn-dependent protease